MSMTRFIFLLRQHHSCNSMLKVHTIFCLTTENDKKFACKMSKQIKVIGNEAFKDICHCLNNFLLFMMIK